MKGLSAFFNNYVRWRHRKGFGVHSPFAYRLVKDVINPGVYGFYGYSSIEKFCRKKSRNAKELKFILRLAVFLKSDRIIASPDLSEGVRVVAKCCGIRCREVNKFNVSELKKTDLLVLSGESSRIESLITEAVKCGAAVVAFDPPCHMSDLLKKSMDRGLLMNGENMIILVPRKEMAFTHYLI